MAKKNPLIIIYECPFCPLTCFETRQNLALHLYKYHMKDVVDKVSTECVTTITNKQGKWILT